jgi:uncharacterized protein (DUF4213/DUF364 family)
MSSFNQGVPGVPTLINTSNCIVVGNTASGNALSVQQLGAGNVATFQTTTGATALFIGANGRVGLGTTNPATALDVYTGTMNTASVIASTAYNTSGTGVYQVAGTTVIDASRNLTNIGTVGSGAITSTSTVSGTTLTASTAVNTSGTGVYQVAGTTVIDASRNLTNIGTVGSGAITSTSTVSGTTLTASTAVNTSGTGVYQVAGTTVIDASRNLTNIGTVGSGAITSTSTVSGTTLTASTAVNTSGTGVYQVAGTTVIDASRNLTGVLGTLSATPGAAANVLSVIGSSTTGNVVQFSNSAGGTFIMTNAGRVGIGTTSPNGTTHVWNAAATGGPKVSIGDNTAFAPGGLHSIAALTSTLGAGNGNSIILGRTNATNDAFQMTFMNVAQGSTTNYLGFNAYGSSYTAALAITAAGNVGIGTTSPGYKLQVLTTGGTTSQQLNVINNGSFGSTAANVAYSDYITYYQTSPVTEITSYNFAGAGSSYQYIPLRLSGNPVTVTTGNVGIGTASPGAQLDVYGGTTRNFAVTDSTIITESTGDNFSFVQFRVNTNGTPKYTYLTLKNAGQSNQFWICANNSWTTGVYLVQNGTAWSSSSDARLKNIIEPISNALSKVEQINPCIYSLKDDETNKRRVGVIAQDVYKVLPEAVDSTPESEQMMGVQYSDLIPLALAAIKELSAENTALKARLDSLEQRLAAAGL